MLKNLIFAVSIVIFVAVPTFAQNKVDNFLGNWKLTEVKGALKDSGLKSMMTLNITQNGNNLNVERTTEGIYLNQIYNNNRTNLYKIDGTSSVQIVSGQFGGVLQDQMRVLKSNQLRFDSKLESDLNVRSVREIWSVSDDGKMLTIETIARTSNKNITASSPATISSKMIFSK